MSRAWLAFGLGLLVLASPLRLVWAGPGASAWAGFGVAALLLLLAAWVSRGEE